MERSHPREVPFFGADSLIAMGWLFLLFLGAITFTFLVVVGIAVIVVQYGRGAWRETGVGSHGLKSHLQSSSGHTSGLTAP